MTSLCDHTGAIQSFAGLRVLRVASESVVMQCTRCGGGVRVGRCHGTTAKGRRCRKPVAAFLVACRWHRDTTVVRLSDLVDPWELPGAVVRKAER